MKITVAGFIILNIDYIIFYLDVLSGSETQTCLLNKFLN